MLSVNQRIKLLLNQSWLILPSFSENFGNVVVES